MAGLGPSGEASVVRLEAVDGQWWLDGQLMIWACGWYHPVLTLSVPLRCRRLMGLVCTCC